MVVSELTFLKQHAMGLRKCLGILILISVGLLYFNLIPTTSTFATNDTSHDVQQNALINGLANPYPAPAIEGITAWINSTPLQLSELKGKVILIDFWTYSCINCIRTLPYVKSWFAKYHGNGLLVIGVHTPEFDFEKDTTNVRNAVTADGIHYPVALDSNYTTWQNFSNQYWPAQYLIDQKGNIVYQHFGEGEDDVMENNIRFLLGLNKMAAATPATENMAELITHQTPETYLGFTRAVSYASPETIVPDVEMAYTFPMLLDTNHWAIQGKWKITNETIVSADNNSALKIHFHAKKVYIVMGTAANHAIPVKILLNGQPVIAHDRGKDVMQDTIQVTNHRLYEALSFDHAEAGILELHIPTPGLEVYTFTFGDK